MSSNAADGDGASQRVCRKADAVLVAATRPLPASEHRSTADQRQAFIEHLYSDYSDLHAQQVEIHDRKNQMDFDLFESNQQEIHDVLFANVEAADGALGDWDTWEKVEAVMKRYAYGRRRHTAQEKEEDAAMRSRIDALNEVVSEKNATIQALTQTCKETQQELGGVLKLLHMKKNEIKTLSHQHHTATLQLHYVQRECAALRGLRNQNEASLLKQDFNYLIEANKKLEAENQLLRGRQQVVEGVIREPKPRTAAPQVAPQATPQVAPRAAPQAAPQAAPSTPRPTESLSVFVPLQPLPQSTVDDNELDRCLEDDAFRHEFLQKEVPLSGAVVKAKRETAHWKKRLEAEVSCIMEMLDSDAAVEVEARISSPSLKFAREASQGRLSELQNGVFISYASYENAPLMRGEESTISMLVAPASAAAGVPLVSSSASVATTAKVARATNPKAVTAIAGAAAAATSLATTTSGKATAGAVAAVATTMSAKTAAAPAAPATAPLAAETVEPSVSADNPVTARADLSSNTPKSRNKPTASMAHGKGHISKAPAAAAVAAKKPTHSSTQAPTQVTTQDGAVAAPASTTSAFAPLQSSILRCTELSRANAMRRELLHVAYLRQMLADRMARAASHVAAEVNRAGAPQQHAMSDAEPPPQREKRSTLDAVATPPLYSESVESAHAALESATTPSPQRLRQQVRDSRMSLPDVVTGEVSESDGGEIESRAVRNSREDDAATQWSWRVLSTRTPTPPPLSRPHAGRVHSDGRSDGHCAATGGSPATTTASSRLPLPLRQRAAALHDEVAALRRSAVTYWTELQDAFAILGRLFGDHEGQMMEAVEQQATEQAMEGAAGRVLEEAALQRTAQILQERFGSLMPASAFTPVVLPESATDEEWLVNELRTAAAAMIKESVHPHAPAPHHDVEGAGEGATLHDQLSQLIPGVSPSSHPSQKPVSKQNQQNAQQHAQQYAQQQQRLASLASRDFFEAEILRPFRLQPNFAYNGGVHANTDMRTGAALRTNVDDEDDWDAADAAAGSKAGRPEGRAVGGIDARSRNRPAPASRWYWRTRNSHDFGTPSRNTAAAEPRQAVATGLLPTFTAAWRVAATSLPLSSEANVQSIRPTVLRYVFDGAHAARQRATSEHIRMKTAFLYGSEFKDFVQEYIVPVISAASGISAGGQLSPAMRAAVQDLRLKERVRRKRGVRLLFERVANNIRTRHLLHRNVYHGEAFVSYVGLLYSNWRAKLERDRQRVQRAQEANRNAIFSLLQLRTSASPTDTLTRPAPPPPPSLPKTKPGVGSSKRAVYGAFDKSSFHFDDAKFNAKS